MVGVRGFEPPASTSRIMSANPRGQIECGPRPIFLDSTTLCTTLPTSRIIKVTNTRPSAVTIIRRTPSATQSRKNISAGYIYDVANSPYSAYSKFLRKLLPRASCACVSVSSCLVCNVDKRLPTGAM